MGDPSGAPRGDGRAPSAEGTLAARPLSHLLIYSRTKRLSGRLVLRTPDGNGGAMALWRGRIAAARTLPPREYFGAVAAEMGFVDRATAEATQREAAHHRRLHGEILIAHGRMTAAQRDAVLTEQTCRKVHYLFGALPAASAFAFYEDPASAVEPAVSLDPTVPLWRALCDGRSSDDVRGVLAPVMSKPLRIVNEAPLARVGFSADEQSLIEVLISRPMTIAQMRHAFPKIAHDRIDRFVYLLLITTSAEPVSVSAGAMPAAAPMRAKTGSMDADAIAAALKGSLRPSGPVSRPSGLSPLITPSPSSAFAASRPPPSASGSPAEARPAIGPAEVGAAGIVVRAQAVDDEDPFQTLGLAAGGSAEAARSAYFKLVKMWHPDRLPPQLASVRSEVGKIFAVMTQAHHTLTDPEARRTFLAAQVDRAAVLKRPRKDVLRLIDTALAKKDFSFAGDESRKLLAADPDDVEALVLLEWITTSAGEGPESTVRAALPVLDRAINRDAQCTRAHFYRGMLNKRLGNAAGAYRDFGRVMHLEPKHVEATREVRIYEMRMKK